MIKKILHRIAHLLHLNHMHPEFKWKGNDCTCRLVCNECEKIEEEKDINYLIQGLRDKKTLINELEERN